MEISESVKCGIRSLVGECPGFYDAYLRKPEAKAEPYVLFCTIAPNPQVKVPCYRNGKSSKIEYGALKHHLQYRYCMKILRECYLSFLKNPTVIGVSETQPGSGRIHFHFLIQDAQVCNDTMLHMFRQDVLLTPYVQANLTKRNKRDYMNNIVRCTDVEETLRYLEKDDCEYNRQYFPVYYRLKTAMDPGNVNILMQAREIIDQHTISIEY